MRQPIHFLVRISFVFLIFAGGSLLSAATIQPTGNAVPGEVLVKIEAGASSDEIAAIEEGADIDRSERVTNLTSGTIWRLHSRSLSTASLTAALGKNPKVVYAEPNYILHLVATPNDPGFSQLWGLKNTGQNVSGVTGLAGADIGAEAAWSVSTGAPAIVVGVVDTGVDYTHPDLAANIWSNPGGKGNAACAAGTHGYNAITKTCDPRDDHYHGTHVSGTIGAVGNNGVGVVGVAWNVSIMGLKFLNAGGYGSTADAIAAIDFAVQAKIDGVYVRVLSNSWGGLEFSKALLDEINKANEHDILFVAAAGNDSVSNDVSPHYPAAYNTLNMIAVAATDNRDELAYFSNWGPTTVHLGAPGVSVLSCYPGASYITLSGTSMATPHVSGVAALLLSQNPALTTAQVKSTILASVDPLGSLAGKTITGGRLNAARALGATLPPDFRVSAGPSPRSIQRGGATTYNVVITALNGFNAPVDLSVSGLPFDATGTFTINPATTTSTLNVTTSAMTPLGSFNLTISGVSGGQTRSTAVTLSTIMAPPLSPCPSFSFPASYETAYGPVAAATEDFNRDGTTDLALVSTISNRLSILLGRGDGGFFPPTNYVTAIAPVSVAAGDFNRDGTTDLAIANSGSNSVSVRLGNGDGTFQAAVDVGVGTNPFWLVVGDFNGDGKADLATANNGSNNVSVVKGRGDGTFDPATQYGAGSGPFWIDAGDFNRDGKTDLAVAAHNDDKVSVLLGNGDGTFQAAVSNAAGTRPSSVAVGDFNGDGKPDLAVANYVSNNVSVLLGNGGAAFQAPVHYPVGSSPYSVTAADVTGDGKVDLVVTNNESSNVSLLLGRGDGTFAAAINYTAGSLPSHAAVGDFNGDGRPDLAVANAASYYIAILRNTGTCSTNCSSIGSGVQYAAATAPQSVAAGDFNGDGKADLAVANNGANSVSIALGNGDGTLQTATDYGAGSAPRQVIAADLNGDGKFDLAVANGDSTHVSVLLGNGDGTFQGAVSYGSGSNPHALAAGDFNRDGKPDLAVANSGSNNVSILLGDGSGSFQAPVDYPAGSVPESVAIGDVNRDGKADLVVADGSGGVSILAGNGDGTFQTATSFNAGTSPSAVLVGDVNRDGKADLVVANSGSNNVSILLGNGNGTFQAAVNFGAGANPYGLAAGDFNDDGTLDLAVANHGSNDVFFLAGSGDGTFAFTLGRSAGSGPYAVVAADFNRDGKPDVAVANDGSGNASVLLNSCPAPDLVVLKSHSETFVQGATGKTYTILVGNAGAAPTQGSVSVADVLPIGLNATAMSGSGWSCTLATLTCTRSDALAGASSYPPITVTVNVSGSAAASLVNTAVVSGGGELNTTNDSTSDPTAVAPVTDLVVTKKHAGSFTQGDTGKTYTITVRNTGGLPTSAAVTVVDTLPAGLTATAIGGTGWSCTLGTLTCTRGDSLAASSNFPPITVTVNVAANAAGVLTNTATVSGGGESNTANDTAADATTVWSTQTCGSFGPPTNYTVTSSSGLFIGVADFNRDGKVDLAAINSYASSVSVLPGNGNGTFGAATDYAVGFSPVAGAIADLNNDGKADIVTANYNSHNVSVLLGNGDGTFAPAASYAASDYPYSLTAGDFNGDGNVDVAVGDGNSYKISILLGNGNGTLQPAVSRTLNGYAGYLVNGDFNGDGKIDLAATNIYNYSVMILRGNGDGTFQDPVNYSAGYYPNSIAIGDFDEDGNADLAVTHSYLTSVSILLGNGDATFDFPVDYAVSYGGTSVAVDDINGDGNADLVAACQGSNTVATLLGNGDGTFQSAASYYTNNGPTRLAIADFNADGKADLANTTYYYNSVAVMLGGCPDLTVAKSHFGDFAAGQEDGFYQLTVSNAGVGGSRGTVTVTDLLPGGLTAMHIGGSGWACDLATVRCTRSDTLAGGASWPTIDLFVSVAKTAPASLTNTASVSGGGDVNPANNGASDPTTILQVPDLIISKSHDGTFVQGETGRTYTLVVGNVGTAATGQTVVVTDLLPFPLTATAMAGPGWSCTLSSLTCSRSDPLPPNGAYPPITLTVSVGAPPSWFTVTNVATVAGGGQRNTNNDSAYDLTRILATPTNLVATAVLTSQVSLAWDPAIGASSYQVLRSADNVSFSVVGTPTGNTFADTSLQPNKVYFYRVRAVDATAMSPMSNLDLAMTMIFTDDPLLSGASPVRAVHLIELRTAINILRAAASQPPATFTDPSLGGRFVKAVHILELRTAMNAARSLFGLPPLTYTDSGLGAGSTIRAAHVRDLRAGVR